MPSLIRTMRLQCSATSGSCVTMITVLPSSFSRWKIARISADDRDRKSTRLNSSHQIISYAVFCLKKKKKNLIDRPVARRVSVGSDEVHATITASGLRYVD